MRKRNAIAIVLTFIASFVFAQTPDMSGKLAEGTMSLARGAQMPPLQRAASFFASLRPGVS
jgi:hypothetical protein